MCIFLANIGDLFRVEANFNTHSSRIELILWTNISSSLNVWIINVGEAHKFFLIRYASLSHIFL